MKKNLIRKVSLMAIVCWMLSLVLCFGGMLGMFIAACLGFAKVGIAMAVLAIIGCGFAVAYWWLDEIGDYLSH